MGDPKLSCILLAAGSSIRFRSPKALARIGNRTIIERLLTTLLETKVSEIIVVLGADADAIQSLLPQNPRLKIILNPDHTLGQTSSFKAGLAAVSSDAEGVLLFPVDTPFIKHKTIRVLMEVFSKNPFLIVVPTHENKKGHPPIFSRKLFQEFNDLKNSDPISNILRAHEAETLKLPVADEGVVLSLNTPEEFEQLLKRSN